MNILIQIDGWLAMLRYGRGVELRWRGTGRDVLPILRKYGVKTYMPGMSRKGERTIRVPAAQGQWAEYLCLRAGVPLMGEPYPANCNVKQGPMPKAWQVPARSVGLAGAVFNLFMKW